MIVEPRDKRRKRRKPKNTALIVGDGQTEQLYFESLNERHGRISIISIGTGKTGINQSDFSKIENGKRYYTFEQCKRIALALNTSMDYLAGLTDVEDPYPRSN